VLNAEAKCNMNYDVHLFMQNTTSSKL